MKKNYYSVMNHVMLMVTADSFLHVQGVVTLKSNQTDTTAPLVEDEHLVTSDGADMSPGHLPSYSEGSAVDRLQLDVQRGAQPICFKQRET